MSSLPSIKSGFARCLRCSSPTNHFTQVCKICRVVKCARKGCSKSVMKRPRANYCHGCAVQIRSRQEIVL